MSTPAADAAAAAAESAVDRRFTSSLRHSVTLGRRQVLHVQLATQRHTGPSTGASRPACDTASHWAVDRRFTSSLRHSVTLGRRQALHVQLATQRHIGPSTGASRPACDMSRGNSPARRAYDSTTSPVHQHHTVLFNTL